MTEPQLFEHLGTLVADLLIIAVAIWAGYKIGKMIKKNRKN